MPVNRSGALLLAATLALPAGLVGAVLLPPAQRLAAEPAIKPPIRGLVSMGAFRFVSNGKDPDNTLAPLDAKAGIFGGMVVIATWKQLQPTPNAEIGDAIDKALAEVRAYNERNPQKPVAVKLRVWGGFEAPEWAMHLGGGGPIHVTHNEKARTLGHFWTPAYRHAWAQLQEKLAAKYDHLPLIREVSVTQCMSFTAEPFYLPDEPSVKRPLLAAGYHDGAHRQCLENAIADYGAWKASRLVLSLNPFYGLSGKGDPGFTEGVMRKCRQEVGRRCVFDNHDLDTDPPKTLLPIFAAMKRMGPEIEFQTYHETPKNFEGTIKMGISLGASSIELWQDYHGFPEVPDAQLRRWAALFERK